MIGKLIGIGTAARHVGEAVGGVAEVFVGNRAERDAANHERYVRALAQYGEEFTHPGSGWFDGFVNGLNRLPRPMMAIGTLGLFAYSMVEPQGFTERMQGLGHVPEPLWWLLGAIVSFYFGARELHHYRGRSFDLVAAKPGLPEAAPAAPAPNAPPKAAQGAQQTAPAADPSAPAEDPRQAAAAPPPAPMPAAPAVRVAAAAPVAVDPMNPHFNAALEEWRRQAA
jgi:pyruvate/2-oxoglutarate dehydrogenase complex dihydrolipoamide acyltransferase (E2) component